ncbi:hypothetical protein GYMLUDRAFT_43463 [Collybiopsis luxurians FD-317 M1]|uniref:Uncharacterized protein n=1 Tax=Collybiopsis luxurians FD-317 M1 TaxID=944289 RepID=A0A0D0CPQ9_9AGAR|nr:hypothetical protein GYMLUDRAFT_43463 [Collybiopsis luxurians FD-317 M1]
MDNVEIELIASRGILVLDWLSVLFSLFVNLVATSLIAFRAWNHHRILAEAVILKESRVQNILLLLIESGAIYCAIQALYIAFLLLKAYANLGIWCANMSDYIGDVLVVASAWYPIAVVILVNIGNSSVTQVATGISGIVVHNLTTNINEDSGDFKAD